MRTKRPIRTTLRSPRAARRRTVLDDTLRIAAASPTQRKTWVGEPDSDGQAVAWGVLTGRKGAAWSSCAQAGTAAVRTGSFGSRFITRVSRTRSQNAIQ